MIILGLVASPSTMSFGGEGREVSARVIRLTFEMANWSDLFVIILQYAELIRAWLCEKDTLLLWWSTPPISSLYSTIEFISSRSLRYFFNKSRGKEEKLWWVGGGGGKAIGVHCRSEATTLHSIWMGQPLVYWSTPSRFGGNFKLPCSPLCQGWWEGFCRSKAIDSHYV